MKHFQLTAINNIQELSSHISYRVNFLDPVTESDTNSHTQTLWKQNPWTVILLTENWEIYINIIILSRIVCKRLTTGRQNIIEQASIWKRRRSPSQTTLLYKYIKYALPRTWNTHLIYILVVWHYSLLLLLVITRGWSAACLLLDQLLLDGNRAE